MISGGLTVVTSKDKMIMILLLFVVGGLIFTPAARGAYIAHSLVNNYSYDLEQETAFNPFMAYRMELEQKLNFKSYAGNLYLSPELTYY